MWLAFFLAKQLTKISLFSKNMLQKTDFSLFSKNKNKAGSSTLVVMIGKKLFKKHKQKLLMRNYTLLQTMSELRGRESHFFSRFPHEKWSERKGKLKRTRASSFIVSDVTYTSTCGMKSIHQHLRKYVPHHPLFVLFLLSRSLRVLVITTHTHTVTKKVLETGVLHRFLFY